MAETRYEDVTLGKQMTEQFTDFSDETLIDKKPIPNWPCQLGLKASEIIRESGTRESGEFKVLVAHGGVGRTTLELMRHCSNLRIDHSDRIESGVLKSLLDQSRIQWHQQLEGSIVELKEFNLDETESGKSLLTEKNNSVTFWKVDYKVLDPELKDYDVIVADFRYKDSASDLDHILKRLNPGGILILGSIDDTRDETTPGPNHSLQVLKKCCKLRQDSGQSAFPHIYRQTRNKHQYAISYFSVWCKDNLKDIQDSGNESKNSEDFKETILTTADYYEDQSILESYDRFHFGEGLLGVKNFPLRMAEVCIEACRKYNIKMDSALDAGCGPGRTALELCSVFGQVEAYDYSQGFVDMMINEVKKRELGNLVAYQGDSHKQEEICQIKKFDLIHGCNLIDRLHSPEKWVLQSKAMLNPGGLLVISSPYTWMAEHTPIEKWIGGFKRNGENFFTADGLKELLQPELALLEVQRIPFVIPDADGTFQYTYSNCTIFGFKE